MIGAPWRDWDQHSSCAPQHKGKNISEQVLSDVLANEDDRHHSFSKGICEVPPLTSLAEEDLPNDLALDLPGVAEPLGLDAIPVQGPKKFAKITSPGACRGGYAALDRSSQYAVGGLPTSIDSQAPAQPNGLVGRTSQQGQKVVRPKWFTLCFFLGFMVAVTGILALINISNMVVVLEKPYRRSRLDIIVSGCDVDIVSGPNSVVRLNGITHNMRTRFSSGVDEGDLYFMSVSNPGGCGGMQRMRCRDICLLTIVVSESRPSTVLHVYQDPNDKSSFVRVQASNVVLQGLQLVGSTNLATATAGPTIEVALQNVVIQQNLWVYTSGGNVYARDIQVSGQISVYSDKNDLWLMGVRNGSSFRVRSRGADNDVCVASNAGHSLVRDPSGPWALCNAVVDWQRAYTLYDTNKDGFVDQQELLAGLTTLGGICCGDKCPFYSYCDPLSWKIFPQDPSMNTGLLAGRANILTSSGFKASLQALNLTGLVPRCQREVQFIQMGQTAPKDFALTLMAYAGRATLIAYPPQGADVAVNVSAADLSSAQLTMLQRDALAIQSTAGSNYGMLTSRLDAFVTFDVVPTPGVPPARFVYVTRPVFLSLQPAYMFLVSASLLTPTIVNYRAHFRILNCTLDPSLISHSDALQYPTLLTGVYDLLQQALRGDGRDTASPLRGLLVFILGDTMYYFPKDPGTGETTMQELEWGDLTEMLLTALLLDIAMGLLIAGLAVSLFYRYARWQLQHIFNTKKAMQKVHSIKYGTTGTEDQETAVTQPFADPVEMVNLLIVRPLFRSSRRSVAEFLAEQCEVYDPLRHPASHELAPLSLSVFTERYEWFCLDRDLPSKSPGEVQRELMQKHRIRVFQTTGCRLVGVKWREPLVDAGVRTTPTGDWPMALKHFFNEFCEKTDRVTDFIDVQPPFIPPARPLRRASHAAQGSSRSLSNSQTTLPDTPHHRSAVAVHPEGSSSGSKPPAGRLSEPHPPAAGVPLALIPMLERWCGAQVPDGFASQVPELLGIAGKPHTYSHVRGVEVCQLGSNTRRRVWQWYCFEMVAILLQVVFLLVPPIVVVAYVMNCQDIYARTMATEPALQWAHVLSFRPGGETLLLFQVVFVFEMTVFVLMFLRMMLSYVACHHIWLLRHLFGVVSIVHWFLLVAAVGGLAGWAVLSSILYPSKLLPYGVAVVVLVTVVAVKWKSLSSAAKKFRTTVATGVHDALHRDLHDARRAMQDGSNSSSAETASKVTAADLFACLDKNRDGVLTIDELRELFERWPIGLSARQVDQLFAFCDANGNGEVSQEEFQEGWDACMEWIVEQTVESAGLSTAQIVIICLVVAMCLILLFCFIFVAAAAWLNEDNFNSVIQSFLLAGSGKAASLIKSKVPDDKAASKAVSDTLEY
eukprot:GGOE01004104.1.p1 GENE.GGOE01004104.1~~GGOE01004104.1.p1  ORF type:complete len:1386 (-),score=311.97 GGOE01004104.1:594-4751(-)